MNRDHKREQRIKAAREKKNADLRRKGGQDQQAAQQENISSQSIMRSQRSMLRHQKVHRSREEDKRLQSEVSDLHEAVQKGYPEAVKRLLNDENADLPQDGLTPLAIVKDCILQGPPRDLMHRYYAILYQLLEFEVNTDCISDRECFVIENLRYSPLHFGDLTKKKYPNNAAPPRVKVKHAKYAHEVFDGDQFNIQQLQEITPEFRDLYLYDMNEDFALCLEERLAGRDRMGIKLGKIYFDYYPDGKGSFNAEVYVIDKEKRELVLLHQLLGDRYNGLRFEAFIPFYLGAFNASLTANPPGASFDFRTAAAAYAESFDFRRNLVQLALNRDAGPFYIVKPYSDIFAIDAEALDGYLMYFSEEELMAGLKDATDCVVFKITDFSVMNRDQVYFDELLDLSVFEKVEFAKVKAGAGVHHTGLEFAPHPFDKRPGSSFLASKAATLDGSVIQFQEKRAEHQSDIFLIPDEYLCPITGEVMENPVTTVQGQTYEKASISEWIARCQAAGKEPTDPKTNAPLHNLTLVENRNLQDAINLWHEEVRERERQKVGKKGHSKAILAILQKYGFKPEELQKEEDKTTLFKGETQDLSSPLHPDQAIVPDAFCCGITFELMKDPVMTPQGTSYERQTILDWIAIKGTDPVSIAPLSADLLVTNYILKEAIETWQIRQQQQKEKQLLSAQSDESVKGKEKESENGKEKEKEKEGEKENKQQASQSPRRQQQNAYSPWGLGGLAVFAQPQNENMTESYSIEMLCNEHLNFIMHSWWSTQCDFLSFVSHKNPDKAPNCIKALRQVISDNRDERAVPPQRLLNMLNKVALKEQPYIVKEMPGLTFLSKVTHPDRSSHTTTYLSLLIDVQEVLEKGSQPKHAMKHFFKLFDFILAHEDELGDKGAYKEYLFNTYPAYKAYYEHHADLKLN